MNQYQIQGGYYAGRFTPEEILSMEHRHFARHFGLIRIFEPWMIAEAQKHVDEGYSYKSFAGKFHICQESWIIITRQHPELIKIRDAYNARVRRKKRAF